MGGSRVGRELAGKRMGLQQLVRQDELKSRRQVLRGRSKLFLRNLVMVVCGFPSASPFMSVYLHVNWAVELRPWAVESDSALNQSRRPVGTQYL